MMEPRAMLRAEAVSPAMATTKAVTYVVAVEVMMEMVDMPMMKMATVVHATVTMNMARPTVSMKVAGTTATHTAVMAEVAKAARQ